MKQSRTSVLVGVLALLAGCEQRAAEISLAGPAQGTTYNVKVVAPPAGVDGVQVRMTIDAVLEKIDRSMSGYRDDSEISRFNASTSTDWFTVSSELATVVAASQEVSAASAGALDITVAPLVDLWGFGPAGEPAAPPDQTAIEAARSRTGYRLLEVRRQPPALRKQIPQLNVDLNGVAPGFTVDMLATRFGELGIRNFMIDIGGEVLARGRNAAGNYWHIAVEKPVDTQPQPFAILQLPDLSVTTSGDYRHYYVRDGRRYSHTIDPRTAQPVQHNLASVVLVGQTSLAVDAWATALNVLGAQAGFELAAQRGMPAMFIVHDGAGFKTLTTPGFAAYVVESGGRTENPATPR